MMLSDIRNAQDDNGSDGPMIFPVELVSTPGDAPIRSLLLVIFPLKISKGDKVLPTDFSHARVSTISL